MTHRKQHLLAIQICIVRARNKLNALHSTQAIVTVISSIINHQLSQEWNSLWAQKRKRTFVYRMCIFNVPAVYTCVVKCTPKLVFFKRNHALKNSALMRFLPALCFKEIKKTWHLHHSVLILTQMNGGDNSCWRFRKVFLNHYRQEWTHALCQSSLTNLLLISLLALAQKMYHVISGIIPRSRVRLGSSASMADNGFCVTWAHSGARQKPSSVLHFHSKSTPARLSRTAQQQHHYDDVINRIQKKKKKKKKRGNSQAVSFTDIQEQCGEIRHISHMRKWSAGLRAHRSPQKQC